jgi:hypothetical protein
MAVMVGIVVGRFVRVGFKKPRPGEPSGDGEAGGVCEGGRGAVYFINWLSINHDQAIRKTRITIRITAISAQVNCGKVLVRFLLSGFIFDWFSSIS